MGGAQRRRLRTALRRCTAAALTAGLLAGCGPSEDDQRRAALDAAVAETVGGVLAFNLTLDAPDGALGGFGDAAGPLAGLLAESSAAGVIEEDRLAVGLTVGGVDLLQARVTAPGEQFVRFDLGGLVSLAAEADATLEDRLAVALDEAGLDPAARDAVLAAARGEWVRLRTDGAADGDAAQDAGTSVRAALEELLSAVTPVGHEGDLEREPFYGQLDVEVDLAQALAVASAALANVDVDPVQPPEDAEVLEGRLLVADGLVRALVLELGPLASAVDSGVEDPEDVELVLDLRTIDPGGRLVRPPEDAVELTAAELEAALAALDALAP